MEKLTLSKVVLSDLKRLVDLREEVGTQHSWIAVDSIQLHENERRQLEDIRLRFINTQVHLFNEATIWSRVIYPLLLLAEKEDIQIWAEVPLKARYAQFEVEGVADGVLGKSVAGRIETPYLVMVETKRGIEGENPVFQLYGQLLAAARLNWENDRQEPQEIFGGYTIADSWTFVRGEVSAIETDRPCLKVEFSREYTEKTEIDMLLKILKSIVARHLGTAIK
ncbi:MAG: hypothetical protein F6K19_34845 [Cyanothece sp. SIO1E1]|nr:hypothetical protein [Cyanothece sp. SIO1E1]